jgi:hypothetical protein
MFGSHGWTALLGERDRFQLSKSVKLFLFCAFTRRAQGQLRDLGYLAFRRPNRRQARIQDDFRWPLTSGFDPDDRLVHDLRVIRETRRRLRETEIGYEEQSSKRTSDIHKVLGHKHELALMPTLPRKDHRSCGECGP